MQQLKTKLKNSASSFNGVFRNSCIAVTGLAVAGGAHASLLGTDVNTYLETAKTDGEGVGKLIIGAVCVLAAVGIIIGLLRKA